MQHWMAGPVRLWAMARGRPRALGPVANAYLAQDSRFHKVPRQVNNILNQTPAASTEQPVSVSSPTGTYPTHSSNRTDCFRLSQQIASYRGHFGHAKSWRLQQKLLQRYGWLPDGDEACAQSFCFNETTSSTIATESTNWLGERVVKWREIQYYCQACFGTTRQHFYIAIDDGAN